MATLRDELHDKLGVKYPRRDGRKNYNPIKSINVEIKNLTDYNAPEECRKDLYIIKIPSTTFQATMIESEFKIFRSLLSSATKIYYKNLRRW